LIVSGASRVSGTPGVNKQESSHWPIPSHHEVLLEDFMIKHRCMTVHAVRARILSLAVASALTGISTTASAAFFQLAENNASGIGNAFAGGAAIAEDASTVWYNPAGLTQLSGSQFTAAGHFISPSTKFTKTSANITPTLGGGAISGGNGGDAGESAIVPNGYYATRLDDRTVLGVGVNAPFGLATDYEEGWVGRYHADRSEIKTVNVNVGLGYKVNDQFSVGGGINYQRLDATLTQAVDFGSICTASGAGGVCGPPGGNDGRAHVSADDDTWGYNAGVLWNLAKDTRLGMAYRSKMKYELQGDFDITAPANVPGAVLTGGGLVDSAVNANVTLPATWSISGFHQLTPHWALMADVTRTFWSELPELRIDFSSSQGDSVVTLGLKDVNRYSLGVNFMPGGAWVYRAGIALDETPTPSAELRTPRLPDQDRLWLALGASYRASPKFNLDIGFVHLMVDDADINKSAGTAASNENFFRGSLVGTYEADINILSVQGTLSF
jgi:long-chain fatty acid transport protein